MNFFKNFDEAFESHHFNSHFQQHHENHRRAQEQHHQQHQQHHQQHHHNGFFDFNALFDDEEEDEPFPSFGGFGNADIFGDLGGGFEQSFSHSASSGGSGQRCKTVTTKQGNMVQTVTECS